MKLRVGIPVNAAVSKDAGGAFSYYDQLIHAIDGHDFGPELEFVFLSFEGKAIDFKPSRQLLQLYLFKTWPLKHRLNRLFITLAKALSGFTGRWLPHFLEQGFSAAKDRMLVERLKAQDIHLLYFLMPGGSAMDFPMVITHWDIGHRSTAYFPELTGKKEFVSREWYYREILAQAFGVLVETQTGKDELLRFMPVYEGRVAVVPFFPGRAVHCNTDPARQAEILAKLGLQPATFFFYPAQFWAHKNHTTLVEAFARVIGRFPSARLVLTGSDKGNLSHLQNLVKARRLEHSVVFPGFVDDDTLHTLYRHAAALVMPTFLGPSNLPLLEAYELQCPAIVSDLPGHRELLGDYGVYIDPHDPVALASRMCEQLEQPTRPLAIPGSWTIARTLEAIRRYFTQAASIRSNWQ